MFYLWVLAHGVTAAIIGLVLFAPLKRMLSEAGTVKLNFRQRDVVSLMGLLIVFVWVVLMLLASIASKTVEALGVFIPQGYIIAPDMSMPITALILGAGLFGLIDDLLGSREASGFRGHIGSLVSGKLTTGALKAIGIPMVAIFASSLISMSILELLGDALLIALFVNTLNLLDLRPGRALKVYIPLQLFLMFAVGTALASTAAALLGIALILVGPDLKEEVMLGDTGSNILGGVLGFFVVASFDWNVKAPLIILLIAVQLLTEKYSISALVERTPVLRTLDNLGRKPE